ncbi:hypothetical protein [Nitratireductor luteus]|uniref:hypothetical protein n=1 Tax=Nitratireductor luteus TaxID=2976980 RepID=UPI00223FA7EE|nr:hypothetical protein [Nitratireductor luteus]
MHLSVRLWLPDERRRACGAVTCPETWDCRPRSKNLLELAGYEFGAGHAELRPPPLGTVDRLIAAPQVRRDNVSVAVGSPKVCAPELLHKLPGRLEIGVSYKDFRIFKNTSRRGVPYAQRGISFGWAVDLSNNHSVRPVEISEDIRFPETEIFTPRAEAAWIALQRRYAGGITDAEIDYLFACFVLGLTSPAYAEREPALHFDLCRAVTAVKLPPERAHAALHTVPEPTQPWLASACALIESQGAKMGRALQETTSNFEDLTAGADAATERPGNNEGNAK